MRDFAQSDRFVSEVEARKLRAVYVFVGDEVFFRKRCPRSHPAASGAG